MEIPAPDPDVAILAEYDALPNGHSCGHNLIAAAALCAIVGLKNGAQNLPGRVVFLGTPAEEGGGGKIILLDKGALKGVDAAMMAHPFDGEACTMPALATRHLQLTFRGTAAHAAVRAVGRRQRALRGDSNLSRASTPRGSISATARASTASSPTAGRR